VKLRHDAYDIWGARSMKWRRSPSAVAQMAVSSEHSGRRSCPLFQYTSSRFVGYAPCQTHRAQRNNMRIPLSFPPSWASYYGERALVRSASRRYQ
jgi:hypothetical protein